MSTWGDLLVELAGEQKKPQAPGVSAFDVVRRKYLELLAAHTGRNVIVYATRWTSPDGAAADLVSIVPEDIQGFMEVVHGLPTEKGLDLVLHSPGGSPGAAESIVKYLRSKFNDIRVFVPHAAMSAATMLSCASNRVVMGRHSFLGPIDPQMVMTIDGVRVAAPAYAILEQFKRAKDEISKNASLLPAWLPILRQYGPSLIVECELAQELSVELAAKWLEQYMFVGDADGPRKANEAAQKLASHGSFKTHGRFLNLADVRNLGLVVEELEADHALQNLVLSVFHATIHTFNGSGAAKLIENHKRRAWIKSTVQFVVGGPPGTKPPSALLPISGPPAGPQ
jgi:hypothetical protein